MARSPYQDAYDQVIRLMAETLMLPPAVEPYRLAACVDRWREQRVADICINEFGDEARAEVRARLHRNAEGAQRVGPGAHADDRRCNGVARSLGIPLAGDAVPFAPLPPAEMRCVSGKPITEGADGWNGPLPAIGFPFGNRSFGDQEDRHVA